MSSSDAARAPRSNVLPRDVLEAIIANIADAVLAIDPTGAILTINREGEKIYGVSAELAVGRSFGEICLAKERLDPVNDLILHAVGQPNELVDRDVDLAMGDGTQKHLRVRSSLLRDLNTGKSIGLIVILSDITVRVQAARERAESGMFLFTVIVSLLIAMTVNGIILKQYEIDPYAEIFAWIYTAIIFIPIIAYIRWLKTPLETFGVTLRNWRQSLSEGAMVAAGLFLTGLAIILALRYSEGKSLWDSVQPSRLGVSAMLYALHSFIQEFVSRGVVLSALRRMFRDQSKWVSIFISALVFGFLHVHIGVAAIGFTFAIGLLFGWMFLRHGTLIGVTLAHIVLGWSAYLFGVV